MLKIKGERELSKNQNKTFVKNDAEELVINCESLSF